MTTETTDVADLHPLEVRLLRALEGVEQPFDEGAELGEKAELEEAHLRSAVGWLHARGVLAIDAEDTRDEVALGDLGEAYHQDRVPELRVYARLGESPVAMKDLKTSVEGLSAEEIGKAFGALKKAGAVAIDKGNAAAVEGADLGSYEALQALLARLAEGGTLDVGELSDGDRALVEANARKRGSGGVLRLTSRTTRRWRLAKPEWVEAVKDAGLTGDEVGVLTPEMLRDGSWREKSFRRYNLSLSPARVYPGRKHPYMEFLDSLRTKLLAMGFTEMVGSLVETEFWNNDALFMPQHHPARDIHDAYFVKSPRQATEIEEPFGSQVAAAHRDGGATGSKGWGYDFDFEKTRQLILRTQGTACSSRQLAEGASVPGKYFSIARCFRYDQVDATHLSDFYQVEGIVLGHDIAFTHLLGLLDLFAKEVAKADETMFAPAYFPFTEPSVELHARHPVLGWMELGGAGLFRPEVTRPLGVDVPVIAWGLGVDRMAMVALGVDDIRDLFSTDLDRVRRMAGMGERREEAP